MSTVSTQHLAACLDLAASAHDALGNRVKEALDVIYDVLETYGEEHVSISFNGGKDCTVLLHLYAAALFWRRQQQPQPQPQPQPQRSNGIHPDSDSPAPSPTAALSQPPPASPPPPIPSIYIATLSPFHELEAFIAASEQRYTLSLFRVTPPPRAGENVKEKGGDGMKYALQVYKHAFPEIEAILVGTRRGDPHGGSLAYKNPTDSDWPRFMRVHPVIDWSYADIWDFLRRLDVPYCELYDAGYTSLGSTFNTRPNPALRRASRSGVQAVGTGTDTDADDAAVSYLPAYELQDGALERAGRVKLPSPLGAAGVSDSGFPGPAVESYKSTTGSTRDAEEGRG